MPVAISFVSDGAWGAGVGAPFSTPAPVDTNFYNLKVAVEALEDDRPQPNNIASITLSASGTQMNIHLDDATVIGPLPLPILQFRDRGEYLAGAAYLPLDVFTAAGKGLYSVLAPHTAAGSFEETAAGGAIAATALVENVQYKIAVVGTTDFTLVGAASNTVGVVFTATGAGTGTGTAAPLLYHKLIGMQELVDPVTSQAGTAYALVLGDKNSYIRFTSSSDVTVTVPTNASVAFPISTTVAVAQANDGPVTIVGDVGVTLNLVASLTPVTNGKFAVAQMKKVGADEWDLFGNLVPA